MKLNQSVLAIFIILTVIKCYAASPISGAIEPTEISANNNISGSTSDSKNRKSFCSNESGETLPPEKFAFELSNTNYFYSDAQEYNRAVKNTQKARAQQWNNSIAKISGELQNRLVSINDSIENHIKYHSKYRDINMDLPKFSQKCSQIINLNKVFNECTEQDLSTRVDLLYAKTKTRFFFITQTLEYFIPFDSIDVYADAMCTEHFMEKYANYDAPIIIALWVKMKDNSTGKSSADLVVRQFGKSVLNWTEVNFAKYNNGGNYEESAIHKFNTLFRNIPKPMVLCYQIAKANGSLSTLYFVVTMNLKGIEQMYNHVLLIDKSLRQIDSLQSICKPNNSNKIKEVDASKTKAQNDRNKQREFLTLALMKPKFDIAPFQLKEKYLQDSSFVYAAAKTYLQERFPSVFEKLSTKNKNNTKHYLNDFQAGTCESPAYSEVVTSKEIIEYYLKTAYMFEFFSEVHTDFSATEQGMLDSLQLLLTNGQDSDFKGILMFPKTATEIINVSKSTVLKQEGYLSIVGQRLDYWLLVRNFNLPLHLLDSTLLNLFISNPKITQSILLAGINNSLLFSNIESLPDVQRIRVLKRLYTEPEYKVLCELNPDEIFKPN